MSTRGLLQGSCFRRHAPLYHARRWQALPIRGLLQVCPRRYRLLRRAWRRQALPAQRLHQGSCWRWHTSLHRAWWRQALQAPGLYQASRSRSWQSAAEPCTAGVAQPRAVPGEATRGRGRQPPGSRRRRSAPIHAAHVPPRAAAVGRAQATHALLAVHGAGRTPAPAHRPQLLPRAPRAPGGGDGLHDVLRFVRSLRQHRVPPRHHRAWTPLAAAAHAAAVAHVACDCSRLHLLAPAPALVRSLLPPRAPHLPPAPPPPPPSLSRPSTLKPSFNSVRSKRLRRLRTNEGRTPRGP